MSDGRLDGNFIREVHDRGPLSNDDWRRDQAAMAVAQESDDFTATHSDIS